MVKESFVTTHKHLINEAFAYASQEHSWSDNRGLVKKDNDPYLYDCEYILPHFEGMTARWAINNNVYANYKSDHVPSSIVDLGCGPTGKFLHDCAIDSESLATYTGINAVIHPEEAKNKTIKLIQGNAQFPGNYIPEHSADFVTSTTLMPYLADPLLCLFSINKLLKRNRGIALISEVPVGFVIPELKMTEGGIEKLKEYCITKLKMNVEMHGAFFDLSWRHSDQIDFKFPVYHTTDTIQQRYIIGNNEAYTINTVKYALKYE